MRRGLRLAVALALLNPGCALQLGSGIGVSLPEARPPQAKWSGNASAAFVGTTELSVRAGVELDGRHEYARGTTFQTGANLGFVKNPSSASRLGGGLQIDFGTPLSGPTLFPDGDFYAGITGEALIWLGGERGPTELNASPWLLVGQPELVLRARARSYHHFDDDPAIGHELTIDLETGVGLRIRFVSEYF